MCGDDITVGNVVEGGEGVTLWYGDEDIPGAGNYVAGMCGNLRRSDEVTRGQWPPTAIYRHRAQSAGSRRRSITMHGPHCAIYLPLIHTISQALSSSSYVIFPSAFILCDYSCKNIFYFAELYYYFRKRNGCMSARDDTRVIRCREERTINCRHRDIFILDINF